MGAQHVRGGRWRIPCGLAQRACVRSPAVCARCVSPTATLSLCTAHMHALLLRLRGCCCARRALSLKGRVCRAVVCAATVQAVLDNGKVAVATVSVAPQKRMEVDAAQVFRRQEGAGVSLLDLADLAGSSLNSASALNALVARFSHDVIYTMSGPVLVALNPYALVNDDVGSPIYSAPVMYRYRR